MQLNQEEYGQATDAATSAFLYLGPLNPDMLPAYDHITSGIGAAMIAWFWLRDARYVTSQGASGLPNRDDVKTANPLPTRLLASRRVVLAKGHWGADPR